MSDKKTTISEFMKKYNQLSSTESKEKMIKAAIRRTYVPVIEKKLILDLMVQKSVQENDIKYIDMFVSRINFIAAIITLYTTLLPDKDEDDNPKTFEMYDALVENGILDIILEEIGEREFSELTSINGTIMDNWHATNASTEAYIHNLAETVSHKFGVAAGAGMEKLADVLDDEVKFKRLLGGLEKVVKKVK